LEKKLIEAEEENAKTMMECEASDASKARDRVEAKLGR
jgi:hypothetical protein